MSSKEASVQDYLQKAGTVSKEYLNIFKNKFASTVVDTVYMAESITKNVLPGNPVTRDYEIFKHIGSAGPGLLWKMYAGIKKSTKQEATIFVLNKKNLEIFSKRDRDFIVEAFKKGATQLARIKHPRILSLQHQLEESKDSLAFATEPCFASLANVLGNHENMPLPLPNEFTDFKLLEVEIKYGLMQLAEGLSFLHKDCKILHRNICPESIVINSNGAWKIAGFELFVNNINDPNDPLKFPFKEYDGSIDPILNPRLEYLAPEYGLNSQADASSDMFSYGMLFFSVYNEGKTLYKCDNSYSNFVHNVEDLRKSTTNSQLAAVPTDMKEYLKMLLHINPELRPDASQVMKIPFFDDVAVKTLEYLDSSFQVDNLQKSLFFKSLPQIIDKLPQRVCLQRIIPCLEQEFINPDMIPFLLPNIFLIADQSTNEEYVKYVLPRLKPIFKLQKPVQILLIVLRNMAMILSKTPPTDIKEHILPMVCRALESETIEIQELCLTTLPSFTNLLDTQTIKHQLIPRIRKLILESSVMSVKINSLVCIGNILEHLEKWIVLDDILPILERITVRDSGVLMAMLGIFKVVFTHPKLGITKDILATRVIPFLIPISIDPNLNMKQFTSYMTLIKEMLSQIESEQRKKLEQIEAMDREKSIIPYSIANTTMAKQKDQPKQPETMMGQLMIGYGVSTVNDNTNNSNQPASFNPNNIINPISATSTTVKKEMTLDEKQQLASKLEQQFSNTTNTNKDLMSQSISLSNLNNNTNNSSNTKDYSYLTDLNFSSKPQHQPINQMTNSFSMMGFNNNSNNKPSFNSNNSTMNSINNNSNNMGFFGNLALPAPPTVNNKMNTNNTNNLFSINNNNKSSFNSNIPNLAPPPSINNNNNLMMKPVVTNNNGILNPTKVASPLANNNVNNANKPKSALDDLADIFG